MWSCCLAAVPPRLLDIFWQTNGYRNQLSLTPWISPWKLSTAIHPIMCTATGNSSSVPERVAHITRFLHWIGSCWVASSKPPQPFALLRAMARVTGCSKRVKNLCYKLIVERAPSFSRYACALTPQAATAMSAF